MYVYVNSGFAAIITVVAFLISYIYFFHLIKQSINQLWSIWRRERRVKTCPQWEELQQMKVPPISVKVGPVVRKPISGCILVILSVLFFLLMLNYMGEGIRRGSILITIISLLFLPAVFTFAIFGAHHLVGTRIIICPYCRKSSKRSATIPYQICSYCKKPSIRQGDFFTPEDYIRNLPEFQDLPKF